MPVPRPGWLPLVLVIPVALGACARRAGDATLPPARPLEATAGERFTIALESAGSAGQRWYLDPPAPDPGVVRIVGSQYRPPAELLGGGEEIWTFDAVAPGTTTLVFSYRRPWASHGTPPARRERFAVRVRAPR